MKTVKIAFYDTKKYDRDYFGAASKMNTFGDISFSFDFFEGHLSEKTAELAKDHDAVCLFVNDQVTPAVADILYKEGVRLIALRCAGYNNVDLKAVYGKLHVVRVPAYSPHAVAEYAVALMQTLNRKVHQAYNRTRDGNFMLNGLVGSDLYGKTAGIIGTGKIGKVLAEILHGYGMKLLFNDVYPDEAFAKQLNAVYVDRETLFKESDYISLHCPLTPENHHLVNAQTLALMKPNVILINTGRGALIDSKALIDRLVDGKIRGAALDVYEEEERYFFEDWSLAPIQDAVLARLIELPNVLLTSHQAFLTADALEQIALVTLQNVRSFINGQPLDNEICYHCEGNEVPAQCKKTETGSCWK